MKEIDEKEDLKRKIKQVEKDIAEIDERSKKREIEFEKYVKKQEKKRAKIDKEIAELKDLIETFDRMYV